MPGHASKPRQAGTDAAVHPASADGAAPAAGEPRGVVRTLDGRGRRHVYTVGEPPADGHGAVELGSLHGAPRPGAEPVWLTGDGRLVTAGDGRLPDRPAPLGVLRWCLAPATWREVAPPLRRARVVLGRLAAAPAHLARRPPVPQPEGEPVGWLDRARGERSLPLWQATHPITGDLLLTTNRWEAIDLGYGDPILLGHLDWAAPLTGRLGGPRADVPWASRFGRNVRSDRQRAVPDPPGRLEAPAAPVRPPFKVHGLVLTPNAPVARVEVLVDGRPAGRARLGLERPELAAGNGHVDAPVSGWEHVVLPAHVPAGARRVTISAVAREVGGGEVPVGEVEVELAEPDAVAEPARAAQLRERGRRAARGAARAAESGRGVLVFTHSLSVGGAQLYLAEVLWRLSFRPETAITVVSPEDGPLRHRLEEHGIAVHVTAGYGLEDPERYEARLAELAAWAAPQGFDVALVNTMLAFPGLEVADLLDIPSVFAVHESFDLDAFWIEAFPPGYVPAHVRARGAAALRCASAVIFEARATRDQWAVHGDPARFLTLPYGIEFDRIDAFRAGFDRAAARRALGLPAEAKIVLCLGTIEPRKAQAPLAVAFGEVADQHPDALLALVGALDAPWCAPYATGLRDRVLRAGLSSRIEVRPLAADPLPWHGVADVMVCASDVESLPRVVLEAMAFETPVLATSVFGLPEVVHDGRTGWLCEPRDVAALAAGLDRVLGAPAGERAAVARAGSAHVRARHDPEAYFSRFARLLEGLAADRDADPAGLVSP